MVQKVRVGRGPEAMDIRAALIKTTSESASIWQYTYGPVSKPSSVGCVVTVAEAEWKNVQKDSYKSSLL